VIRQSITVCGQQIERPGHICAFFTSREEEYETLIPYLRDGIEAGEQVVNVLDEVRVREHRDRLQAAGVTPDGPQLAVATSEATYLADGHFDMARMVGFVREHLERAKAEGKRVRTAGWMDWINRNAPGTRRVMEYEARMNLLTPTFDCTFMCVYDLLKLDGEMIVDVMATHPYVVLKGRIRQNPFYVPPEVYLHELLNRQQGSTRATEGPRRSPRTS